MTTPDAPRITGGAGGGTPESPASQTADRKAATVLHTLAGLCCFGGKKPDYGQLDANTRLAHERTDLAFQRSYLALERTLQAWIRTTLSMISFGFTLGKLGQAMHSYEIKGFRRDYDIKGIAYFLVMVGTFALLMAMIQHLVAVRELRAQGLRNQPSIAFPVALLVAVLGGFAFGSMVVRM